MIIYFPKKGKFLGTPSSQQMIDTSRDLNNVRPIFDGRWVGGQRPGVDKKLSQQISSAAAPVVDMCSVTTVD